MVKVEEVIFPIRGTRGAEKSKQKPLVCRYWLAQPCNQKMNFKENWMSRGEPSIPRTWPKVGLLKLLSGAAKFG